MTAGWPLRSYLELGALVESARTARLHAGRVVGDWNTGLRFGCELIVGELMSNAVRAAHALGQRSQVRLWLRSDTEKVMIVVWDASPVPPRPPAGLDPLAEGGRGLRLVGQASEQWSWYHAAGGGKAVWALCGEAFR